ncbi:ECF transporter S component [Vagococcus humatus]|uniref:ECF transporter S component n=1 Tax=Vagococcus humatus TaxID=1889241 RepID=A0A3S0GCA2_9ENTE|nr:ECF transporter S component [Vagococcus humatus]RST88530.1 ECF transporter S component [Vagococcus humatus]
MAKTNAAHRVAIRGILIAIILLQAMIPFLGYIPLFGVISITTIHVTVIVAAIVLGPKDGMLMGFIWGMCTLIRANVAPTSIIDTLVFRNPLVSVLPRMIVGLVAGFIFRWIYQASKNLYLGSITSAAIATLTNTILVLGSMAILYTDVVAKQYGVDASQLLKPLGAVVLTNGVPEAIFACLVVPLITRALKSSLH